MMGDKKLKFGRYRMFLSLTCLSLKLLKGVTFSVMRILTVNRVILLKRNIASKV